MPYFIVPFPGRIYPGGPTKTREIACAVFHLPIPKNLTFYCHLLPYNIRSNFLIVKCYCIPVAPTHSTLSKKNVMSV